jgi:hypothetical protein
MQDIYLSFAPVVCTMATLKRCVSGGNLVKIEMGKKFRSKKSNAFEMQEGDVHLHQVDLHKLVTFTKIT